MIPNPAAPAVRRATSQQTWDWDWHLDSMSPALGSDYDNNGIATRDLSFSPSTTASVVLQYKKWGIDWNATGLRIETNSEAGARTSGRIISEALVNQIVVARSLMGDQIVVGAALRSALFSLVLGQASRPQQELLAPRGGNISSGVVWKPSSAKFRLGLSFRFPVISDGSSTQVCDPLRCAGYILPDKVKEPWQLTLALVGRGRAFCQQRILDRVLALAGCPSAPVPQCPSSAPVLYTCLLTAERGVRPAGVHRRRLMRLLANSP